MDKRTIIGIALIIVITLLMPVYQKWITGDQESGRKKLPEKQGSQEIRRDSVKITKPPVLNEETSIAPDTLPSESKMVSEYDEKIIDSDEEKIIYFENDLVRAIWSTKNGGNPVSWELKQYDSYEGGKVNLIKDNSMKISFLNADGKQINLNQYNFYTDIPTGKRFLTDDRNPEQIMKFYLPVKNGRIIKEIRFYNDRYSFDVTVTFENLSEFIINRKYFISWENGLPLSEKNISDDNNYARGFVYMAEELESIDASDDKLKEQSYNGRIDWIATRTKYFLTAILPSDPSETNGAVISGIEKRVENQSFKKYTIAVDMKFNAQPIEESSFKVYLGPMDYYVLKNYDAELQGLVMNRGWYERLFRPISLLMIPIFKFLYRFIPNYGFVIIIFSILLKIILHPLTKKSYKSMSEMQFLQPKMTEMREKYKNEPQRLNKEMMKLYKEHGVNPLGGCLPMLLQMPVLFALFIVFRSTIQLRGKPFILWINDLSSPDTLYLGGINLPLIGDNIHVLPILMGLTMIWQSKMTMTDPKQKMMVYFMPIFMIFIFYSLPSGLNLYYAVFNLLSMVQTRFIKKKTHPEGDQTQSEKAGKKTTKRRQQGNKSKK